VPRRAPPPPDLEAVKREFAALATANPAQQVAALRKLSRLKTPECARFLADVHGSATEPMVRQEALRVLGLVGLPPAKELLTRAAKEAPLAERPAALRALSSLSPKVDPEPFLAALRPSEPLTLRMAAALALRGYPTPEVASELAVTLVEQPGNPQLARTCEASLSALAQDPAVRTWLRSVALARPSPLPKALPPLLRVAGGCSDDPDMAQALLPHLRDAQGSVRIGAADALGELAAGKGTQAQSIQDALCPLLKDPDGAVVVSAAMALGAIGPGGDALDRLVALGRSRSPTQKALALTALEGSRDARVLKLASKGLTDKSGSVRAAAVAALQAMRTREAVTAMVAGLKKNKSGRIHAELLTALRALTHANPGDDHRAWDRWWDQVKEDFALPSGRPATGGVQRRSSGETATRGVPTYHGSEVVSRRVTFIVDISGSMSAQFQGEERAPAQTRTQACKKELKDVIAALPKRTFFNVIWFSTGFHPWAPQLTPAGAQQKAKAIAAVEALKANGGTNIFDTLESALADPEVDTIYLLSDGGPSAGRITDPEAILREVKKLNAVRRVAIHTISVGSKSPFMASLAQQNNGTAIVR
jgi:HEAT repeat protein